jgi:hypothetical protein
MWLFAWRVRRAHTGNAIGLLLFYTRAQHGEYKLMATSSDMFRRSPSSCSPTRPRRILEHMYTVARTSHCSHVYPSTPQCPSSPSVEPYYRISTPLRLSRPPSYLPKLSPSPHTLFLLLSRAAITQIYCFKRPRRKILRAISAPSTLSDIRSRINQSHHHFRLLSMA